MYSVKQWWFLLISSDVLWNVIISIIFLGDFTCIPNQTNPDFSLNFSAERWCSRRPSVAASAPARFTEPSPAETEIHCTSKCFATFNLFFFLTGGCCPVRCFMFNPFVPLRPDKLHSSSFVTHTCSWTLCIGAGKSFSVETGLWN